MMAIFRRRAGALHRDPVDRHTDDARPAVSLDVLKRDVRYAIRSLARTPGFTIAAALALALGIGATTAMLSVVNGVLLQPLPYRDSDRLVVILRDGYNPVAPANVADWRAQTRSFTDIAVAEAWGPSLLGSDGPERISGLHVSAGLFPLLGAQPLVGRGFAADEEIAGNDHVAVIGYGLWQRRFGGSRAAIGSTVSLDGVPYTIVGVMPPTFRFAPFWITDSEIWAPLALGERGTSRTAASLRAFARLRPGVTLDQARADLAAVTARLEREYPGTNRDIVVQTLKHRVVGDIEAPLFVLLVAVGFVLLIACANVAHMLLARGSVRQREMAVRTALGATRRRIVAQLLVESLVLAGFGGAIGLAIAYWGVRALVAASPSIIPRVSDVSLDSRVLAMSMLLTLATAVVFGLVPALRAARLDLATSFRDGSRGSTEGGSCGRLRSALVAVEFAVAVVLLVGAGLMVRTFVALRHVDPGFDPRGVVTMTISVNGTAEAAPASRVAFFQQLLPRIRALPGVASAAYINHLPLAGDQWGFGFTVEGHPRAAGDRPSATYRVVTPGYFETMRIPLLRGRGVSESDRADGPPVVVINDHMARTYWPGEDPIGKRISFDDSTWMTVVGVAKNTVRGDWSAPPSEELFVPFQQADGFRSNPGGHYGYLTLVARASCAAGVRCDAASLAPSIVRVVREAERAAPIGAIQTMSAVVSHATTESAFYLVLLGAFALFAVTIAGVGVYGVMSYAVARRRNEIGIRLALGAEPGAVRRLVVGQGLRLAAIGAVAGATAAIGLTQLLRKLLFGVSPTDPVTFAGVVGVLGFVALAASWFPARRATRIDPVSALRGD